MAKTSTLPPPIVRIYREAFAALAARNTSPAGINAERWVRDANTRLRQEQPHAVKVGERVAFLALLTRELGRFIRMSRETDISGAAELGDIGRLQRRLAKEVVVFYGTDGKPVRKMLRDVRMDELPKVVSYYRRQSLGMTQRGDRYETLHQQMQLRGFTASDLVGQLAV